EVDGKTLTRPSATLFRRERDCNTVGWHVDPAVHLFFREQLWTESLFQAGNHPRAGFARPDDRNPADRIQRQSQRLVRGAFADDEMVALDADVVFHQPVAADGIDAGLPNGESVSAEIGSGFHGGGYLYA